MAINSIELMAPHLSADSAKLSEKSFVRTAPECPPTPESIPDIDILDIRGDAIEIDLKAEILSSLRPEIGLKNLPTLLLYDEKGLQIFEEVRDTRTNAR